ncbi:hypothetical protein [Anaerotalea alkaliphila]|uniref:Uncharacterized protein n=1 Tax=Anaerotalea alkaliphila TaxID=2662126 RepID=A0A7X5KMG6_9FIRM|nr:hypothetical protein [Anaerotalea alkaliphila]NDL67966.1 hypothetical protein [Anaerotalea alkaliphila]
MAALAVGTGLLVVAAGAMIPVWQQGGKDWFGVESPSGTESAKRVGEQETVPGLESKEGIEENKESAPIQEKIAATADSTGKPKPSDGGASLQDMRPVPEEPPSEPAEGPVSSYEEHVRRKIRENQGSLKEEDVAFGNAMAGKVDPSYVAGLMENGLTQEERAELKAYLLARLTENEVQRALEIYQAYAGALQ